MMLSFCSEFGKFSMEKIIVFFTNNNDRIHIDNIILHFERTKIISICKIDEGGKLK